MRRMILVAAAVLVAALAATSVFILRQHGAPPPQLTASTPVRATPASTESTAPPTPVAANDALPPSLTYVYSDVDTTKAVAETCLIFSEPLDASGQTDYGVYLTLKPAAKPSIRVDGRRLCLAGLAFGTQYTAEIKVGLPAASGHKLASTQPVELTLTDRPPLVTFRDGLILPRESVAGIPITTVNVGKLHVTVYRVPERLVSQIRRDQLAQRQIYPYQLGQIRDEQGAKVWEGDLAITGAKNATVTTLFPIAQAVPQRKPGIYVLTADDPAGRPKAASDDDDLNYSDDYRPLPVQWVIDTDIGLTTIKGADGLHVFARALGSALPLAGLTVSLIARDNDELAKAVTDADGHLRFDPGLLRGPGGNSPLAVMAYGKEGDFTFEDLSRPAFDLSDRGVDGRALPGPVDAYLYTDRGIYRPRETVHVVALLRDRAAEAMPGTPLTLIARRPDGVEYRRATIADETVGAVHYDIALTETAAHGRWQVDAYLDPKGEAVGHAEFEVEDFVPQRLKVDLTASAPAIEIGKPIPVDIAARFLYGAPGAALDGEADATVEVDETPFPAYRGWSFGLAEEKFKMDVVPLEVPQTDADGHSTVGGIIEKLPETSFPVKAEIRVAIFEPGGRNTESRISLPVRTKPLLIGLHPRFRNGRIDEDSEAVFDVAALDADGKPVARDGLKVELVREDSEYHWYRSDGRLRFERTTYDQPITDGALSVTAEKPGEFKYRLPWGYYRLTVRDAATGAASSIRFSSGWRGDIAEDRPDKSEVSADKASYLPGDTAKLAIRPPSAGEGMLVIASDRVLATRFLHVPAEGATVEVPVTADWGTGAYAIFTHYRALRDGNARAPTRSIGVAWLPIDASPRTLGVELGAPDKVLPRRTVEIPVTLKNLTQGEKAYLTLAAVDEGILQLTRFQSPSPTKFYFGKRRLAVDIRDDYGRLIQGEGEVGAIRSGGDSIGGAALPVVPTKTVALFSGFVTADAQGHVSVPLDIPDFEGELRLMAVAFDKHKLGDAEGHLTVRDPVVSDVVLPRFLAPNDQSRLSLSLHNLDGTPGDYRATIAADGAVALSGESERTVALASGERQLLAFPIAAKNVGIGTFTLHLTGPNGFAVEREWQIAVRSAQDPIARTSLLTVAPGKDAQFNSDLVAGYVPGTATVHLTLATWKSLPVAELLRSLDRYPYGCIEQTTSRAFPLLYFNDVALLTKNKQDPGVHARVQGAVDRLLDMQRGDGNFGFWGPSYPAYDWLSVYALDFLFSARAQGYAISDEALQRGQNWLRRVVAVGSVEQVRYSSRANAPSRARGYAAYVLARLGGASLADLRYLYDTTDQREERAFPASQLAAALALAGDVSRSRAAFARAEILALDPTNRPFRYFYDDDYYGSSLRDWAGLVRVAAETKQSALLTRLFQRYESVDELPDDLTTQEKAWLMLAEHALTETRAPAKLAVNGKGVSAGGDPVTLSPDDAALASGYTVTNHGDRELYATVTVEGAPSEPLPPESRGITLARGFHTLAGEDADLAHLKQNDRLIVELSGIVGDTRHHEIVLRDLLPAGFEIEGPVRADNDGATAYDWLPKQRYTRLKEARDDRFAASFVVSGDAKYYWDDDDRDSDVNYDIAYIVRAVTPGTYILPAATAEDMYRPSVRARTGMGAVTITPR
ncbi:MAG TPA: alpha-2-macroglobulin [Stellaceae bacterium]|nr:alpha-2-macroglobulin [Stellaceae bacterium]